MDLIVTLTLWGEGTIIMPLLFFAENSEIFIHYKIFLKNWQILVYLFIFVYMSTWAVTCPQKLQSEVRFFKFIFLI